MNHELIYEYGKNPINFGVLENPTITYTEQNHLCGEKMTVYIKLKEQEGVSDLIEEISFEAEGRMVTLAAASMLTEKLEGKSLSEISSTTKEDILEMIELEESQLSAKRLKSALLGLLTITNAYHSHKGEEPIMYSNINA